MKDVARNIERMKSLKEVSGKDHPKYITQTDLGHYCIMLSCKLNEIITLLRKVE